MDRTKFADALIERRNAGEPFITTANALAPKLFAEKHADLQKLSPDKRKQMVMSVYGEAHDDGCTAYAHNIGHPSTWAFPFKGVFVSDPKMIESSINKANKARERANSVDCVPLDLWAKSVLIEAIRCMPDRVDFPCDIALLQFGREPIVDRITCDWVPDPKFEVPISESELTYRQGTVQKFH